MAAEALEQSVLEAKDKDQLLAIAKALGLKASARTKKSDIIDQILETTGSSRRRRRGAGRGHAWRSTGRPPTATRPAPWPSRRSHPRRRRRRRRSISMRRRGPRQCPSDADEPPAEWELAVAGDDVDDATAAANDGLVSTPAEVADTRPNRAPSGPANGRAPERSGGGGQPQGGDQQAQPGSAQQVEDGESRNRRRRRRRKGGARGLDGPQGDDTQLEVVGGSEQAPTPEQVEVSGYLDMRDEGYGFLRVKGYLPSRDDSYIPVKLARQYGLRKGDHVTGLSRPAGRNEKNPALLEVHTVNGGDPEAARRRPRFEDLTALFPDEKLRLEDPADPTNMTARIIDLVAPIGKGQRGIIVSPPKAGKTFVMKTIATSIERNNPEVKLIVLLIDERPEEVTDIRRTVQGEVISSTFDRPSDEHTHVAELAIEKAKRLVEQGEDVVVILDGITRLSRAYNLAAPASGRILSGGIDAGALYPPKKFFGAARNVEEGGSLTILATALVDTNSRMDEAIFEEFKGTGNMELRLDRRLAERRIYPAIDVDASSTRHEELLFDRKQLQMVWKLRRVLSGLAADGNAAPGLELLMDRLRTFRTNDEFLNEIAKQPAM